MEVHLCLFVKKNIAHKHVRRYFNFFLFLRVDFIYLIKKCMYIVFKPSFKGEVSHTTYSWLLTSCIIVHKMLFIKDTKLVYWL